MTPAVEFINASYTIDGGRPLVDTLSFSITRGETLVLLGRSGSGKTTTLKMINGLIVPSAGRVSVLGRSTAEWDGIKLRRQIGYVIQEGGLFPHYTVERNIALVPRLEGWPQARIAARVGELLELVGLPEYGQRYPHQLSGGQRQRVGVARALAADPMLLLLDEPFGALDPITRRQLQHEFKTLQERLGKTAVFVTHDVREAFHLATRIGLMQAGKLIELCTPAEFPRSQHPEARAFADCLND